MKLFLLGISKKGQVFTCKVMGIDQKKIFRFRKKTRDVTFEVSKSDFYFDMTLVS